MGTRVRRDDRGFRRWNSITLSPGSSDEYAVRQLVSRKSITAADIKTAFEDYSSGMFSSFNDTMMHFVNCCRKFGSKFVELETLDLTSVDPSSDDPPAGEFSRSDSGTFALDYTGLVALTEFLRKGHTFLQDLRICIWESRVSRSSMVDFLHIFQSGGFCNLQIFHLTFHQTDQTAANFNASDGFWRDFKILPCKTRLSELSVSFSDDSDLHGLKWWRGVEGARNFAEAMASGNLERLQAFGLKRLRIGRDGIQVLAQTLSIGHLHNLQSLDLSRNDIGNDGLKFLADSLQSDLGSKLHTLGLADIGIEVEGFVDLAAVLELGKCPRLTHLYLHGNSPGDGGLVPWQKH